MAASLFLTACAGALLALAGGRLAHIFLAVVLLFPAGAVAALAGGQGPGLASLQAFLLIASLQTGYVAALASLARLTGGSRPAFSGKAWPRKGN